MKLENGSLAVRIDGIVQSAT